MTQSTQSIDRRLFAREEPRSIFGQFMVFMFCWIGLVLLIAPDLSPRAVQIVYNASDSAPRGLYLVERASHVQPGDLVVARLPPTVAALAAQRGHLPSGVPLIKPVAAVAPQVVCVSGGEVRVNGELVASTLAADAQGRELVPWNGCRPLVDTELFLLSTHPASFDSRYFGPVNGAQVIGRAVPLWIRRPS